MDKEKLKIGFVIFILFFAGILTSLLIIPSGNTNVVATVTIEKPIIGSAKIIQYNAEEVSASFLSLDRIFRGNLLTSGNLILDASIGESKTSRNIGKVTRGQSKTYKITVYDVPKDELKTVSLVLYEDSSLVDTKEVTI